MAVKLNEMEKKMTAVDWLESEIKRRKTTEYLQDLFDQAKQLEKQQIVDAYERGDKYKFEIPGEQYYTETYGSERSS